MDPLLPPSLLPESDEIETDTFDLSQTPTSGKEYLRKVRQEARQCAQVVVADIDFSSFKNKQTISVSSSNGVQAAPIGYAPSAEWQTYQITLFSNLRQKLCRYQARQKEKRNEVRSSLPISNDEENWCKLCFGDEFNDRRYRKKQLADYDTPSGNQYSNVGMPPLLHIITSLDQTTVCQLLEYHTKWLTIMGFSTEQGRWLYALLTLLEKPVLADSVSWLRTLVRKCADVRVTIESKEDGNLTQLNLLICLVANYFEQSDLTDRQTTADCQQS